jgi:hypothetical protein
MRTVALLIPATLLAITLSACGGATPTPVPTETAPTVTSTPAPTPEPGETGTPAPLPDGGAGGGGDDGSEAAEMFVALNYVLIDTADDEAFGDFTLFQSAEVAVPILTAAFDGPPVIRDHGGGLEVAPSRTYVWGGFELIDYETETLMGTDLVIRILAPEVAGVAIRTYGDLQVGDPFATAAAMQDSGGDYGDLRFAAVGTAEVDPESVGEAPGMDLALYVAVYSEGGSPAITSIVTPTPNWGV